MLVEHSRAVTENDVGYYIRVVFVQVNPYFKCRNNQYSAGISSGFSILKTGRRGVGFGRRCGHLRLVCMSC